MGDGEADLGDMVAQVGGDGVEVGDARDDVEGLAAAVVLAQQRLADGEGVELADVGADGEAVDRGGGDERELADAGEGELQGAGDGGGGEGEDVDVGAQRLQALLVGDAEVLLLVDDEEAEVLEGDALGEEGVGADDELDAAVGEAGAGLRGVLGGDEAGELADAEGEAAEAFGEVLEVLAGEERGGGDDRDLHAGHGGDEGGAQRDLGLAEADVAADEAVHGLAGFEVLEHVVDGGELVVGLGVGEAGAEFFPGVVVGGREDGALAERALGGDADEAFRHVADAGLEARLLRLPGAAAEAVEQALLVAVAGEELDVLDRQVELVAAGVFERAGTRAGRPWR